MKTFTIIVDNPPKEFDGMTNLRLKLQTPTGYVDGTSDGTDLRFDLTYEEKVDRQGRIQPSAPFVQRQPDCRRFVHLSWIGNGQVFRRLKVFFDQIPEGGTTVRVEGWDRKGGPACASARVLQG